tara:strand:- start:4299 stop:4991 length:693 start_codon:yes stop_codon:yes gene_type:complete
MKWDDLKQGLSSGDPAAYIQNLRDSGALKEALPEVDVLFGVPQVPEYHPEIDTGIHTLMVVKRAAELSDDVGVRFAALVHDLGKGLTPEEEWPKHIGHEESGVGPVRDVVRRLCVPDDIADLAEKVTRYHLHAHRALEMRPGKIVSLLENIGAFENPENFERFLITVQADKQGRLGMEDKPYPQAEYLRQAHSAVRNSMALERDPERIKIRCNEAVSKLKKLSANGKAVE